MRLNGLKMLMACIMVLMAGNQPAYAGSFDAATLTRLGEVRDKLKANGCDKFIVVQAFMDGLIKHNEPYELIYSPGKVTINDVALAEPYQTSYKTMIREFFAVKNRKTGGVTTSFKISTSGMELSAEHMLAATYSCTSCNGEDLNVTTVLDKRRTTNKTEESTVVQAPQQKTITYSKEGVTVNGRKVSAEEERQYKTLYFDRFGTPQGKETMSVTSGSK